MLRSKGKGRLSACLQVDFMPRFSPSNVWSRMMVSHLAQEGFVRAACTVLDACTAY
jgi:hypothetical protein